MGHIARGQYIGGHPAATGGTKKCVVRLDKDAVRVENPDLVIPYDAITAASMAAPRTDRAREFRFSPTAGLLGGVKENAKTVEMNRLFAQMGREMVLSIRDEHGDDHELRFAKLEIQGRTRSEKRADFKIEDPRGGDRFVREILAARYRARGASE